MVLNGFMSLLKKIPTHFQQKVYDAVSAVPEGKVTTYKLLAQSIGCKSAQAIGQALRCNPFAPVVPCHRVIKSDLTIGGFAGETVGELITKKKRLLAEEGVAFIGNRLKDENDVFVL